MRAVLGCVLGLALGFGASADDKKGDETIDAKRLVGKWGAKEQDKERTFTVEFAKDGKATFVIASGGKDTTVEGTYKLDGNKLTTTMKVGGKERTDARTVTRLTDTELVSTDAKGKEETLVRIKDKDR